MSDKSRLSATIDYSIKFLLVQSLYSGLRTNRNFQSRRLCQMLVLHESRVNSVSLLLPIDRVAREKCEKYQGFSVGAVFWMAKHNKNKKDRIQPELDLD